MSAESIYKKTVANGPNNTSFKDRLFYKIIPNDKAKSVTLYYSRANIYETCSIARGTPLFIRYSFKLKPSFFFYSNINADTLDKQWIKTRGTFYLWTKKKSKRSWIVWKK